MPVISSSDVPTLFAVLHDGDVEAWTFEGGDLWLKIRIPYLAEGMGPGLSELEVRVFGAEALSLTPWGLDAGGPETIRDVPTIFAPGLTVLDAEADGDATGVSCERPGTPGGGGWLRMRCAGARLEAPPGRPRGLDELLAVAEAYWERFGRGREG